MALEHTEYNKTDKYEYEYVDEKEDEHTIRYRDSFVSSNTEFKLKFIDKVFIKDVVLEQKKTPV